MSDEDMFDVGDMSAVKEMSAFEEMSINDMFWLIKYPSMTCL